MCDCCCVLWGDGDNFIVLVCVVWEVCGCCVRCGCGGEGDGGYYDLWCDVDG